MLLVARHPHGTSDAKTHSGDLRTMRLPIISDIHVSVGAPETGLAISALGPPNTSCLGDLVGYHTFPRATLAVLRDEKTWHTVRTRRRESSGAVARAPQRRSRPGRRFQEIASVSHAILRIM